ncbi:hypothetical protein L9F63_025539, partial [Diploptera punctata]
ILYFIQGLLVGCCPRRTTTSSGHALCKLLNYTFSNLKSSIARYIRAKICNGS